MLIRQNAVSVYPKRPFTNKVFSFCKNNALKLKLESIMTTKIMKLFRPRTFLSFHDTHNSGARQTEEKNPAVTPTIIGNAKERMESSWYTTATTQSVINAIMVAIVVIVFLFSVWLMLALTNWSKGVDPPKKPFVFTNPIINNNRIINGIS